MFCTWFCTVRWLITSRSAICREVSPLATSRSTSVSRSVSRGAATSSTSSLPCEMRRNSPSTSPARPAVKTVWPEATRSAASSSSSREADLTT